MLIDSPAVKESLQGLVGRLTADTVLQEDLLQEALVRIWRLEQEHPGQTVSWYLQGCRFHLLNYLTRGRSLDAPKRFRGRVEACESDGLVQRTEDLPAEESILDWISVRDFIEALACRIKPFECAILAYLADGFGVREIAEQLHISHQAVSQHRRRIATLAHRLGLSPLRKGGPRTQSAGAQGPHRRENPRLPFVSSELL